MKLAVFISGTGTNMVAIHNAIKAGELDATIELIVSSNDHAKGIQYAQNEGLDLLVFTPADYDDPEAVDARIVEALNECDVDYVADGRLHAQGHARAARRVPQSRRQPPSGIAAGASRRPRYSGCLRSG